MTAQLLMQDTTIFDSLTSAQKFSILFSIRNASNAPSNIHFSTHFF